jgi:branched-chain amino acid transport system permease protein
VVAVGLSGVCAGLVGIVFGLPSLRIRGLYLAVATLASQFFIVWALDKFGWFKNYDPAGVITAQPIMMFGHNFATPREKYWVVLAIVAVLALLAKNMARGSIGRGWMAVRDMDVAAEVMGFSAAAHQAAGFCDQLVLLRRRRRAVSRSPICRQWSRRPSASICRSEFSSWSSSAASAPSWARSWARAFILLMPIFLNIFFHTVFGKSVDATITSALEQVIFGVMIIMFLIFEPLGLARLWQLTKERLRLWPFKH